MTVSVVLADANILFSRTLRDYFLYAADQGAIEIRWSRPILHEMSRNLRTKMDMTLVDTARLEDLMNGYIEYALTDIGADDLAAVQYVEMDPNDRHVLAAAISADADILLTENGRHFPRGWMSDRGIDLLDSGELLTRLAEAFPDKICAAHENTVGRSPKSEFEVLSTLERIAGRAAADAVRNVTIARRRSSRR